MAGGEKVNRAIAFYQVLHEAAEALTPEGGQPCARVEGLLSSTEHSDLLALCDRYGIHMAFAVTGAVARCGPRRLF